MESPLIKLRDIRKTYQISKITYEVLKGINLEVQRGDFLAIMGPSGGGKSTLLNILGLLDKPTSGSYIFEDRDVTTLNAEELSKFRNLKIGFIFQAFHLVPWASALENVLLPVLYRGKLTDEDVKKAEKLLERLGLKNKINLKPAELSGGQQQRVAIARALINQPVLLLADEPTGNLDSESSKEVMDILEELNKEGLTIIMVTHELDIASRAKKKKILRDGIFIDS
ncbi:macrolide ABC transporter ATP-binding protein [Caldimicrobium thiodismutans]|uniref:Macrolide ABC transporter ATP-binding protein n=1 Tax=Caldimicrobium thiodismutans TaxID=1653476 RepID=A0A0U5AGH8_9BACT|nr:ABC transporter ATP-binding protein [Caldimicrobium thiodismutans]BAU23091.1 macrolide ABC transporter ATP-binding protein [Caldimicrobium thiodismutans]